MSCSAHPSVASRLAAARRLFEQGDLTRSGWTLSRLLDTAPDAAALGLVEGEVRSLRNELVERAGSSASATHDLERFDQALEMTGGDAGFEPEADARAIARALLLVVIVLITTVAGAFSGGVVGGVTCTDEPAPPLPPPENIGEVFDQASSVDVVGPCGGEVFVGGFLGSAAGLAVGLLFAWLLRRRRARRARNARRLKPAGLAVLSLLLLASVTACGATSPKGEDHATSAQANDTSATERARFPEWSPDGKAIAFYCGDELCVVSADDAHRRVLTRTKPSMEIGGFDWSPSGRKIAFTRDFATAYSDLYVVDPDGTHERLLAGDLDVGDVGAVVDWSPDGRRLALVAGFAYLMNADGSTMRQVSMLSSGTECMGQGKVPSWSPDGRTIMFSGGLWCDPVCLVDADGSHARPLPAGPYGVWSPDGHRIAFAGDDGIYVVGADGRGKHRLTHESDDYGPRWSPDGGQIAFGRGKTLVVMNTDGSGQRRLAKGSAPEWSPDGKRIAFDRGDRIYVVDADGTNERQLTK